MSRKNLALCCKIFTLPMDYAYIKDNYEKWVEGTPKEQYNQLKEIWLLYPMLIPLNEYKELIVKDIIYYHYTCKHLIKNRCSIQDNKPEMCKIFSKDNCKKVYPSCESNCFKGNE